MKTRNVRRILAIGFVLAISIIPILRGLIIDSRCRQLSGVLHSTNLQEVIIEQASLSEAVASIQTQLSDVNPYFADCSFQILNLDPDQPVSLTLYHVSGDDCLDFLCKDNMLPAHFYLRPKKVIIADLGLDFRTTSERILEYVFQPTRLLWYRFRPSPFERQFE